MSVADLELAIVAAICDVDATPWHQGDLRPEWHESGTALDPTDDSSGRAHLSFAVWATSSPIDETQCRRVRPTLSVRFMYRLRAGQQPADLRQATRAAEQLAAALDGASLGGSRVFVSDAGTKSVGVGGWADVVLELFALDVPLRAAS